MLPIRDDLDGLERGDLVFWPGHVGIMTDAFLLLHANAHHMAVAVEPLKAAADRIARAGHADRGDQAARRRRPPEADRRKQVRVLEPLSRDELQRLWRWERHMTRFHAVAMTALVLCAAAAFLWSDIAWVRRGRCWRSCCCWWRPPPMLQLREKVSALPCAAAHQIAAAPAGQMRRLRHCLRPPAGGLEDCFCSSPSPMTSWRGDERPQSRRRAAARRGIAQVGEREGREAEHHEVPALAHLHAAEQHVGAQQAGRLSVDLDEPARIERLVQDEDARAASLSTSTSTRSGCHETIWA